MTSKVMMLLLAMSIAPWASAHQYHFGITELSLNEQTQTLEVVHKYFIRDIAVAINGGKDVAVSDEELRAYIADTFKLALPDIGTIDLAWIGAESDIRYIWLYQEFEFGELVPSEVIVSQQVLLEVEADQVNTVTTLRAGEVVDSATLNHQNYRAVLKFN